MERKIIEIAKPQVAPGMGVLRPHEIVARTVMLESSGRLSTGFPGSEEIKIACANSLGFEFSANYPDATETQQQEQARFDAYRQCLEQTSALFERRQIPHLYIKFRKRYRYYDSNVDVIVSQPHWRQSVSVLEEAGYSGHVMFKEPDKIMFSKPGERVSVHLHPGVTWNGVPYFDPAELWANSLPSPDYAARELTGAYDLLVNLAHDVFENYEISLGEILHLSRVVRSQRFDRDNLEAIAATNGWGCAFRQIYTQSIDLIDAWEKARSSREIPTCLLRYPYKIPITDLARAFRGRITHQLRAGRPGYALREAYAYPAFYALKRRHDLLSLKW